MKAHDLARILLSMENVQVAFQYWDGGPEWFCEPVVKEVTECEGRIYLTNEKLVIHNEIKLDVEEMRCVINNTDLWDDIDGGIFKDNIQARIDYVRNTPGCEIDWVGQFENYVDVRFRTQEAYDKFINTFKHENN